MDHDHQQIIRDNLYLRTVPCESTTFSPSVLFQSFNLSFLLSHCVSHSPFLVLSLFLMYRFFLSQFFLQLYSLLFLCFIFPSLPLGRCPCGFFLTCILSLRLSPPSIALASFPSIVRLLSSQPEVSTATTLLSRGLRCLDALPPSAHARHAQHIQRYTKIITHHSLGCIRNMFLFLYVSNSTGWMHKSSHRHFVPYIVFSKSAPVACWGTMSLPRLTLRGAIPSSSTCCQYAEQLMNQLLWRLKPLSDA